MRFRLIPFIFLSCAVVACTTPENDRSTHFEPQLFETRVNIEPVDRNTRTRLLQLERHEYKKTREPLAARLAAAQSERKKYYNTIEFEFPECRRQRHCLASLSKGEVERFERYNELTGALRRYDYLILDLETKLEDIDHRHDVNERRIYNRFVVNEMLSIAEFRPIFQRILVHSLEFFPTREAISRRLLEFADRDVYANQIGDYRFKMLGKSVDEGALLLTLDIVPLRRAPGDRMSNRFLVSFLVNTHQRDPQFYERSFLREWSQLLSEPTRERLRKQAFCGLYTVASATLAAKMQPSKIGACRDERNRMQSLSVEKFFDRFPGGEWLLPLSYLQVTNDEGWR